MNKDQVMSMARTLIKIAAGALAAQGMTQASGFLNSETGLSLLLAVVGYLWSHYTHADEPAPQNIAVAGSKPTEPDWKNNFNSLLLAPLVLALGGALGANLAGCASFNGTTTKQTFTRDNTVVTNETSTMNVHTFWDSKSTLTKAAVGQTPKSGQKVGIGSLEQESSGTNTVEALKSLDSILGKIH